MTHKTHGSIQQAVAEALHPQCLQSQKCNGQSLFDMGISRGADLGFQARAFKIAQFYLPPPSCSGQFSTITTQLLQLTDHALQTTRWRPKIQVHLQGGVPPLQVSGQQKAATTTTSFPVITGRQNPSQEGQHRQSRSSTTPVPAHLRTYLLIDLPLELDHLVLHANVELLQVLR